MQNNDTFAGFIFITIIIFYTVSVWKIYTKAGKPGWAVLIPFYNLYVLLKIIKRPSWWIILFLIPYVNIAMSLVVSIDLALSFGRTSVFGIFGLFFFSFIGYPILGFGGDKYTGPTAKKQKSSKK